MWWHLAHEPNPVLMDAARLGHGEQEEIESFERVGHLREKPAGIPAGLRRLPGGTVPRDQILADQVTLELLVQLRQRQHSRTARPPRPIAGEPRQEHL